METHSHPRGSNEGVFVTGATSSVCVCERVMFALIKKGRERGEDKRRGSKRIVGMN